MHIHKQAYINIHTHKHVYIYCHVISHWEEGDKITILPLKLTVPSSQKK